MKKITPLANYNKKISSSSHFLFMLTLCLAYHLYHRLTFFFRCMYVLIHFSNKFFAHSIEKLLNLLDERLSDCCFFKQVVSRMSTYSVILILFSCAISGKHFDAFWMIRREIWFWLWISKIF